MLRSPLLRIKICQRYPHLYLSSFQYNCECFSDWGEFSFPVVCLPGTFSFISPHPFRHKVTFDVNCDELISQGVRDLCACFVPEVNPLNWLICTNKWITLNNTWGNELARARHLLPHCAVLFLLALSQEFLCPLLQLVFLNVVHDALVDNCSLWKDLVHTLFSY